MNIVSTVIEAFFTSMYYVFGGTLWVIVVASLLFFLLFSKLIWKTWLAVTEFVLRGMDGMFIRNQLSNKVGGKGYKSKQLAVGEELQFVVIPTKAFMWLWGTPPANPKRKDMEGKRSMGHPPLIIWPILIPVIASILLLLTYDVVWLLTLPDRSPFPSLMMFALTATFSEILMIPVYWVYEWNRRHWRLVCTNFELYVISVQLPWREIVESRGPVSLIEEIIISSTASDEDSWIRRLIFGILQELQDIGDLYIGSRVQGTSDFIRGIPYTSALSQIFRILNKNAKRDLQEYEAVGRETISTYYRAMGESASDTSVVASGKDPVVEAMNRISGMLDAYRSEHPAGEPINLLSPNILGFTLWDFSQIKKLGQPRHERSYLNI